MRRFPEIGIRILATFLSCLAAGCGSDARNSQQPSGTTIAVSALARNTTPQISDTDLAAVVAGNTTFALKVFPLLDSVPNDNVFFSPYSITQAFALLAPGARGTTLSEIELALSFPLSQDRLNPAFNKLDLQVTAEANGSFSNGIQAPQLNNANAVWGQQDFSILPAYLDTLAVNFGAGLHLVDFKNATETSRQTINGWVEGQTNKRIQNLIPADGVSTSTRLVLTNALWFKANWATPFPPLGTAAQAFINRGGLSSSVPFMNQQLSLPYAQVDGCQAADIPYAGGNLSMLVIMPTSGSFDSFASTLTPTLLGDITSHLSGKTIAFSLPKFSFTLAVPMGDILKSLGMTVPFDSVLADFSGIDGKPDLFVGEIFHQAFVNVDEVGTEAAAATAISVTTATVVSPPDLTLTIDHPFIFLIRDRQTGLILFMGKVVSL